MTTREIQRVANRGALRAWRTIRDDLDRLRLDAGWSVAALARAAGVDPGYAYRILTGDERPTMETYARLAAALGADLALRAYAGTGPALRDRHQAPMLELVLRERHPRWGPYTEVLVHRPARGSIDAVLHEPRERVAVAPEPPAISRLLVVRRSRATRHVAAEFAAQLRAAYPAHPDDAIASLTGTAPWPGPSLVWVALDGGRARFLPGR